MEFAQYMANQLVLIRQKPAKKPVSKEIEVSYVEHSGHQLSEFVRIIRSSEEK